MKNDLLKKLGGSIINEQGSHYIWPRITEKTKEAVLKQLSENISLYDRSGIFEEFENNFLKYHKMKFSLLSNSGTNAIFSMFEGLSLKKGDEIICPTYTFFATISSIVYTGAIPVFCDSDKDGNIDPFQIKKKISNRTKAVIITHMWGMPCNMDEIVNICKDNKIYLLEDCSHAHGASYKNQKVGTFGDAAAWSLQGQKIVTGGEGGIMLTNNEEIYYRATLQGHYNKRCKQVIPKEHYLSKFSLTGLGLKFRAHPLAIAIANEQFSHLDEWIEQKQEFADLIISSLSKFNFLKMPTFNNKQPSWYAFIIQFDEKYSNGVTIEEFFNAAQLIGLKELDRPNSTCPIHNLPLFNNLKDIMPRLYDENLINNDEAYENASCFYKNALKLPVWAFKDEENIVNSYIEGLSTLSKAVIQTPEIFKTV